MFLHCPICGDEVSMDKVIITDISKQRIAMTVQACEACTDKVVLRLEERIEDLVLNGTNEKEDI